MNPGAGRNIQLDVLRGVAILLVMGRHLDLPRPTGLVGALVEGWFRIGWLGVDLFFVLSGFLIGGLLLAEARRYGTISITRFLVRRGFKIYPAYLVFIAYVMAMPVMKAALKGTDVGAAIETQWHLYWPNLIFLQNYVGSNPAGHTWTLAVEEHFYLLLPFLLAVLVAAGRIRMLLPICIACGLTCLALRGLSVWTSDQFYVRMAATHLRIDALMCGVGIRAVAEYLPERFLAMRDYRIVLMCAGAACWSLNLLIEPDTAFIRTIGLTGTYVGSAAFLVAAYNTSAQDFGRWRRLAVPLATFVAWIGLYSYAIYLWHVTAMGILEREVGSRLLPDASVAPMGTWLIGAIVACGGAVIAGVVMTKLVEWPALRLRERFFPSRLTPLPETSRSESAAPVWVSTGDARWSPRVSAAARQVNEPNP